MSDETATAEDLEDGDDASKKGGKGMLFGIILAVVLGGAGFFASYSGMIPGLGGGASPKEEEPKKAPVEKSIAEFVPIDQMVISVGSAGKAKHLKFGAALEVEAEYKEEIELLKPRILDVLNTYLRAVELRDIENPAAMTRLRAQMLRRVNIVTGEGKVIDLLITEFVLS